MGIEAPIPISMKLGNSNDRSSKKKLIIERYEFDETQNRKRKWFDFLHHEKSQSPPCNNTPTHLYRRCFLTERLRASYRDFRPSKNKHHEKVHRACILETFFY